LSAVDLLDDTAVDEIETDAYKAALVGPGLDNADAFLVRFLTKLSAKNDPALPLVIDADGLNILAQQEDWPRLLPPHTILTPHPGEMARLLGQPLPQVLAANRFDLALENAAVWGCVLVLKGAYTIVAAPHKKLGSVATVIPFATPLLGTAGSGDVLAGVIVTLLAQGLSPYDAAVVGAYWHGRVGDYLTRKMGDGGALATEIADALPYTRP
ncbi:MAG: NAD(P)H-hydrate dehydratase, partial [Anaerolineales bacterium]|nr:NAD(P)H-hydrate dehydratase [Anaerolineales bacterium]